MAAYAPKKKKLHAMQLLAEGMAYGKICEEVGITMPTLRRWRKDPDFATEVLNMSTALLKENLPEIYSVLFKEAKKGSVQALKLYIEHIERLEEAKNNAVHGSITFTWKSNDEESS